MRDVTPSGELLVAADLTVGVRGSDAPLVTSASLAIGPGEVLGLVGESGSGKSTLCRAIAALLAENLAVREGQIRFRGRDLTRMSPSAVHRLHPRGIAMVFQDPLAALNPVIRVGDQVVEAVRAHAAVTRAAALQRAAELLDRMGIEDVRSKLRSYPHELSGGQRQRVMLAMAMATDPALLLADEPTSAVDVTTQAQILELLREIAAQRDVGILLVSHDFGVVSQICSRICVMYAGQVVETGPTEQVLRAPAHPYTRGLIDSLPSLDTRLPRLPVIPGPLRDRAVTEGDCPFFPRCAHGIEGICTSAYPGVLAAVSAEHCTGCVRHAEIFGPVRA